METHKDNFGSATESTIEAMNTWKAPFVPTEKKESLALKYPKYYKAIPKGWESIDVYGVCKLFPIKDDTGCIHHAIKKLLIPGTRTGGKNFYEDIKEARDTLNRWLELNPNNPTAV